MMLSKLCGRPGVDRGLGRLELPSASRYALAFATGIVVVGDILGSGEARERGVSAKNDQVLRHGERLGQALIAVTQTLGVFADQAALSASLNRVVSDPHDSGGMPMRIWSGWQLQTTEARSLQAGAQLAQASSSCACGYQNRRQSVAMYLAEIPPRPCTSVGHASVISTDKVLRSSSSRRDA